MLCAHLVAIFQLIRLTINIAKFNIGPRRPFIWPMCIPMALLIYAKSIYLPSYLSTYLPIYLSPALIWLSNSYLRIEAKWHKWFMSVTGSCDAGHYVLDGTCEPCDLGFYQPETGAQACLPCPLGTVTLQLAATSRDQCECKQFCCWM